MMTEQEQKPDERLSERTCAGCRTREARDELLRFAYLPGHAPVIVPDLQGKLGGRGIWAHPRAACLRKAVRGGFARAVRSAVEVDFDALRAQVAGQLGRRVTGLLLAAKRRRALAMGSDAVRLAMKDGRAACTAHFLLVAKDAAGRREDIIADATERRLAVIELSTKQELGQLTGKDELGYLAVLDLQIGREIADTARWLAGLAEDG
ncbi:MAG TPA: DUF448 domain-containing protein [Polyangiales bacterium]